MAHRGLGDLQNWTDKLLHRYESRGRTLTAERDLIERASKITSDLSHISLNMVTTLPSSVEAIDDASCFSSNATNQLSRDSMSLERSFSEWIQSMRNLRVGQVDEALIQHWHQTARLIRQEIARIDLQSTSEWANTMLAASRGLEEKLALIIKRASTADYGAKIDRLKYYQKLQDWHLGSQLEQLYLMGNQTQRGLVNSPNYPFNNNSVDDTLCWNIFA